MNLLIILHCSHMLQCNYKMKTGAIKQKYKKMSGAKCEKENQNPPDISQRASPVEASTVPILTSSISSLFDFKSSLIFLNSSLALLFLACLL